MRPPLLPFLVGLLLNGCSALILENCDNKRTLMERKYSGDPGAKVWSPCEFPNPRKDWNSCGRPSASYICDPEGLLTETEASSLESLLNETIYITKCRCTTGCRGQGTPVGLALVGRMSVVDLSGAACHTSGKCKELYPQLNTTKRAPTDHELSESATAFSNQLKNAWDIGHCDDEVIIFYSEEFGMISTTAGSKAILRLDHTLTDAHSVAAPYILEGQLKKGLENVIITYRDKLANKTTWPMVVGIGLAAILCCLVIFGICMTIKFCRSELAQGKTFEQVVYGTMGGYWSVLLGGRASDGKRTPGSANGHEHEMDNLQGGNTGPV